MDKMDKNEFKKAWYLAYADGANVNPPNFNRLFNKDIERIAATIPTAYWELAQTVTIDQALKAYEARRLSS